MTSSDRCQGSGSVYGQLKQVDGHLPVSTTGALSTVVGMSTLVVVLRKSAVHCYGGRHSCGVDSYCSGVPSHFLSARTASGAVGISQ